ncbi:universal stress protein [Streptomyces sp. JJ36]|nr:universal stress protein [Streptomyces sp. JJ36]
MAALPQPVAAVLTDRTDDVAVAQAAARSALLRQAPLLLIAVLPHARPGRRPAPSAPEVRAVLGRVLPGVEPLGLGHIPAVFTPVTRRASRLAAPWLLLDLASRHRAPQVFAARHSPYGLDAHALIEAASHRGGPRVHAVGPGRWAPLLPRPQGAAR